MKNSGLGFIKIITGVLAIFAVVVIGYQLYKYNFVSIKTESAVMGEMEEVIKSTGIFFRNEKLVDNSGYDFLDVIRSEGERVAAGGVIARVYEDEHSAKVRKEIRQIEEKIATYEEVLSHSGSYQSAASSIDQEIYTNLSEIAFSAHQGNAAESFDGAETMVINIMKKKIASGDLVSYDTLLDELRGELASLKTSGGDSVKTITSKESGYFSLGTDGLEDQFDYELLETLSAENFDDTIALCNNTVSGGDSLGKMVYNNGWFVAMKVSSDSIARLEVKDTVYIRIPSFGSDRIKCTITDIRKNGDESVIILSSSIISDNILTLRQEEISLIVKTYSGLCVRQSALRKVDGEDGVFVKVGLLLRYKKVNILYNDGTNAVIEYNVAEESGLRIYDQVVYKGSNLYDRKAVS
ncbi:MAG: hypothetical protein IJ043_06715 [Clostridia bacterium]|nr:hypothetical protein [Clostridia bacterium]